MSLVYEDTIYNDGDFVTVVAGGGHQFICYTPGIKPAAVYTWILEATSLHQGIPGVNSYNADDSRLVDSFSIIPIDILKIPAMQQLTCGATNRQDGSTDTDADITVTLQVKGTNTFQV